ncbi:MAG TPA: cysteine--tRNA ligase, partial [Acidimicrobiales bacterium]|nr:cysteine--tRNA ligase [Acidimicrobiales bacterium]
SNITDIDDKIITRSAEEGCQAGEIASRYESSWWDAVDRLGVLRPTHAPRATEYVAKMVEAIGRLVQSGHAYEGPGGVWFASESVPGYGMLAHQSIQSLKSGARVEIDESKRSPIDFALWKLAKPNEPSWPSPWGDGRPGWHTECVVMSMELLGDYFDIHAGGMDLQFPHHENERAQALALGHRFCHHWMHHAFVEVGGEKMSKSLGNFTSLTDLLAKSDPRSYRLLVLRAQYRSPMEVTVDSISDATDALSRLDSLARRLAGLSQQELPYHLDKELVNRFRKRMDDDLDTPRACAIIFEAIRAANTQIDSGKLDLAAITGSTAIELASSVGLFARSTSYGAGGSVAGGNHASGQGTASQNEVMPSEIVSLASEREAARAAKEWGLADELRVQIEGAGWLVEDGSGKSTYRPKQG